MVPKLNMGGSEPRCPVQLTEPHPPFAVRMLALPPFLRLRRTVEKHWSLVMATLRDLLCPYWEEAVPHLTFLSHHTGVLVLPTGEPDSRTGAHLGITQSEVLGE